MKIEKISVFGLGKLGATMVGCFASAGFDVVGVDINTQSVKKVAGRTAPVPEPGLQDLYNEAGARITATEDGRKAVMESDASFIIVPTPSTPDGEFFTSIAVSVAESVGKALAEKAAYHLVVLTSTVLPGATERDILPALERASGKKCGKDFGLCYSPEFIAIGNVIQGLLHPDFFLIGEHDKQAGDLLESVYKRIISEHSPTPPSSPQVSGISPHPSLPPPILRMKIPNAELTKIAVNTFVTAKISFANTLARICSSLPGGDAHVVAHAVGTDKRVGKRYLTPGPTFGGPCFPRDNRAFEWFARSIGVEAPLARATDEVNRHQIDFLVNEVLNFAPDAKSIGVLGLSYKDRTNLMEEAQGTELARRFLGRGLKVIAYDPWVAKDGVTEKVDGLRLASSVRECVTASDVVVLSTPHEEFKDLTPADFLREGKPIPLVDTWALLRGKGFEGVPEYTIPGIARS